MTIWRLPLTIRAPSSRAKYSGPALRFCSGNPPVTVYKSLAFQSFAAPMQNSTGCTGLNGISIRSLSPLPPPHTSRSLSNSPESYLRCLSPSSVPPFISFSPFYFFAAFQLFPHSSLEITNKRKTLIDVPLTQTKLYCAFSHLESSLDRCHMSR